MSQPCTMVELVLFDARSLRDPAIRDAVHAAASRGVHRGAIADDTDIVEMVNAAGCSDMLDFWLGDPPGNWPFDRALSLVSADPERVLFVSTDPQAREAARANGLRAFDEPLSDFDQALP